jgi:hypothetical protein
VKSLAELLKTLQKLHAEYLNMNWDTLSTEDVKRFTRTERDILDVSAAMGEPRFPRAPDSKDSVVRLRSVA